MLEDQPPRPEGPLKPCKFLRHGGEMTDLGMMHAQDLNNRGQVVGTTEIDGETRLVLINERGQIVGSGRLDGQSHAYLLTPSSE